MEETQSRENRRLFFLHYIEETQSENSARIDKKTTFSNTKKPRKYNKKSTFSKIKNRGKKYDFFKTIFSRQKNRLRAAKNTLFWVPVFRVNSTKNGILEQVRIYDKKACFQAI